MTKLKESNQWGLEHHVFKCWCGENSYLGITKDDDGFLYISITQHPTSLLERLKLALKALRGIEFDSSNVIMIEKNDVKELIKSLKVSK